MATTLKALRSQAMERVTLLLDEGLDLVNRRLIVGVSFMEHNTDNDVSWPLAGNFFTGMDALEHLYVPPSSGLPPKDRIQIFLSTYGGDLYTTFAIYDRIKLSSVPVDIFAFGQCMSGGSIILQAADRRYLSENARVMLHYGFTGDEGTSNPDRKEEELREHNENMDTMVKIYLEKGNRKELAIDKARKELNKLGHSFPASKSLLEQLDVGRNEDKLAEAMLRENILPIETYLNTKTCLRYGLADEIISPEMLVTNEIPAPSKSATRVASKSKKK